MDAMEEDQPFELEVCLDNNSQMNFPFACHTLEDACRHMLVIMSVTPRLNVCCLSPKENKAQLLAVKHCA